MNLFMSNITETSFHRNPGCLVQLLWFVFVGSWASQLWIGVAWFFMALIVTIPIGISMINYLPKVVALRNSEYKVSLKKRNELIDITIQDKKQHNIILRSIYFVLIGWWWSFLWMETAYLLCCSIVGMPLGFVMFDKTPFMLTLREQ